MKIDKRCIVTLNYILTNEAGDVIDSSGKDGSFTYIHGFGLIMPGIEKIINGKSVGFTFNGNIEPHNGYGEYNPNMVMPVPKEQLVHLSDSIEEGQTYNFDTGGGNIQMLKILKIDEDIITLDGNHPYAGEVLKLECNVEGVRSATEEELSSLKEISGCGCTSNANNNCGGCSSSNNSEGEHSKCCCNN